MIIIVFIVYTISEQSITGAMELDAATGELKVDAAFEINCAMTAEIILIPAYIENCEPCFFGNVLHVEANVTIENVVEE